MIGVTIRRQCEDTEERREESGVREWRNVLTSERTPRSARATRNQESGMEQILSRSLQREPATDISISDFWPWEPRGHTFLLPKPSSLWGFAVTALGEEHTTLPLCQSDWWPARLVTQDWASHSSPLRDMHITQSGPVRISPGVFFVCLFVSGSFGKENLFLWGLSTRICWRKFLSPHAETLWSQCWEKQNKEIERNTFLALLLDYLGPALPEHHRSFQLREPKYPFKPVWIEGLVTCNHRIPSNKCDLETSIHAHGSLNNFSQKLIVDPVGL